MLTIMSDALQELYEMYKQATDDKTRDMIQKQIDQLLHSQGKQ